MDIQPGDTVIIKTYPKEKLTRRVVAVRPPILLLTTDQEWQDFQSKKRDPICIGFPIEDVIRVEKLADSN